MMVMPEKYFCFLKDGDKTVFIFDLKVLNGCAPCEIQNPEGSLILSGIQLFLNTLPEPVTITFSSHMERDSAFNNIMENIYTIPSFPEV